MSRDDSAAYTPVAARTLVAGQWRDSADLNNILDPYRGSVVGTMSVSSPMDLEDAFVAATRGKAAMAALPGYERAALLRRISTELRSHAEHIAVVMARETGKAIKDCRSETARAVDSLELCAEEAVRIEGSHVPMDGSALGSGKLAVTLRFPRGIVAALTPFNAPINVSAQKVGSALAAGNAVILKPSPKAPLSVQLFAEAVLAAGVPSGAFNVVHGDLVAADLVTDRRADFVSFTGSIPVGRAIRSSIGLTPATLELGGVGPTIVAADADVQTAAAACARNAMLISGQSCISVQNVIIHQSRYEEFVAAAEKTLAAIAFGDPLETTTDVGTLIDEAAAIRVADMLDRAVGQGARIATGGHRNGALIDATMLLDVTNEMEIANEEIFGPAFSVMRYQHIEPVFNAIANSPFGLQVGVYTSSIDLALRAHRSLRVGGVIINGTSRWRSDQMPYGGVKDSGIGREGPKFAIRDMTEERLLVFA